MGKLFLFANATSKGLSDRPLEPFGAHLLDTLQVDYYFYLFLLFFLHNKTTFIRRESEGVQGATAKPSGLNKINALQGSRTFATIVCVTQGGFPIAPFNPFGHHTIRVICC